ncbi:cilia- and flagella-associated protein 91-like [Plodia interpunctella]|uniref:cilia- and flagella-associated protein 91-like n=1 Tax=Plodia interpunctella TaxID=58824 RepID=UPI002367E9E5|nr:cilia- and flagella-associated protein 91-like [Plodia interpunctella]
MSNDTLYQRPKKHNAAKIRVHDYLYDSAYIVSGAKDYARTAFRAAMASAQVIIQPVYTAMFSDGRRYPSVQAVYHPNCRLPEHIDRSYGAYLKRTSDARTVPPPNLNGRDRYRFTARPKKVLDLQTTSPDFHPTTPRAEAPSSPRPKNRATQSMYRESSAQTIPWQPDGKAAEICQTTPEVLYLDMLEWGPGCPYCTGDLPADFHTTEIINKLRHARCWTELMEKGKRPGWMKKTDAIITDIETKDWIFREAEIDELQSIRLELLHQMQAQMRNKQTTKTSRKLAKLWVAKKEVMEKKIDHIRRARDRELRKLTAIHGGGGRVGMVQRMRAARGSGSMTLASHDPKSDLIAPLIRHGYQARRRHECIIYDPALLSYEDHEKLAEPPAWLERCGQDLRLSCSGHHLPRNTLQLCERETKWSEQFLESLHNDLKKARLGAASSTAAGPLRVLRPRRLCDTPRPATPEVERVDDEDENNYQAALVLQRILRGRAVQVLMYEGRTRAAELTEELKTTHGLQKEDRARIAREETKAREYSAMRTEAEQTDAAITALVDELCGGAVSAALDFLEKELRRLKEERRQHAFILIALREKQMREAAEAGRRQKEEHRRREHDEMFKQILGVTQETVDAYFRDILHEGVHLAAEQDAVMRTEREASRMDESLAMHGSMSTAEQQTVVAELVQQFLLPEVHKTASRHHVSTLQNAKLVAARKAIFGVLDDAEIKTPKCIRCGVPLGDECRCNVCPIVQTPTETDSRDDPRWQHTRSRSTRVEKTTEERFPPRHEIRCLLSALIDDVVRESRIHRAEMDEVRHEVGRRMREKTEATLDAKFITDAIVDRATGAASPPIKVSDYHHFMMRFYGDALERSVPFHSMKCPKELPSEIRQREEALLPQSKTCKCDEEPKSAVKFAFKEESEEDLTKMLPSEIRALEELRRCKCDSSPSMTGFDTFATSTEFDSITPEYAGEEEDETDEYQDNQRSDN